MAAPTKKFSAPVWVSAFRPFYLLGALYAPLVITGGAGALLGTVDLHATTTPQLWHGHEMLFGFAMAIIIGTVLTALPSWAGTPETSGGRLALLTALWLLGRVAFWAAPWIPPWSVALADALLLPVLTAMLVPQLMRVRNHLYLLLLPILLALVAANLGYHAFILGADAVRATQSLHAGVYAVIVLFLLKGGVLVPVFTGNALRVLGRGKPASFIMTLETAAVVCIVLLAVLDLSGASSAWVGVAAVLCTLVHAVRTARWRGWLVADQPLIFVLHLAFAWLVIALLLKAAAELTGIVPVNTWLHAFTVGALGMMMLGLMNRVALRHTGRVLEVTLPMRVAYLMLFAAALMRLAATVHGLGYWAVAAAALLWATPFVIYLIFYGSTLVRPSLPRTQPLQPV